MTVARSCNPIGSAMLAFIALAASGAPAQAQAYRHYECVGGAHFELALFRGDKTAFVQLDGKAIRLPPFASVTGNRYRKGNITVWVKGDRATLRRAGKRIECRAR